MSDRPYIFSDPMVLALIAGRKHQTRRVLDVSPRAVLEQKPCMIEGRAGVHGIFRVAQRHAEMTFLHHASWRAAPGDTLYVKEAFRSWTEHRHVDVCECADVTVRYRADKKTVLFTEDDLVDIESASSWCHPKACHTRDAYASPLFMPRWMSRMTAPILDVRFEQLGAITDEDVLAEGIVPSDVERPLFAYSELWKAIHGTWDPATWVAVTVFGDVEISNRGDGSERWEIPDDGIDKETNGDDMPTDEVLITSLQRNASPVALYGPSDPDGSPSRHVVRTESSGIPRWTFSGTGVSTITVPRVVVISETAFTASYNTNPSGTKAPPSSNSGPKTFVIGISEDPIGVFDPHVWLTNGSILWDSAAA